MTLRSVIDNDISDVFLNTDDFAVSAVYNGSTTVNVIVDKDVEIVTPGFESNVVERRTVLTINKADINIPARGDTFLIGSTTYTVDERVADDGSVVRVSVHT